MRAFTVSEKKTFYTHTLTLQLQIAIYINKWVNKPTYVYTFHTKHRFFLLLNSYDTYDFKEYIKIMKYELSDCKNKKRNEEQN